MGGTGNLQADGATPIRMLDHIVEGPRAWRASTISESDWLIPIPDVCLDELEAVLDQLRADPLPMLLLDPREFELPACSALTGARRAMRLSW